MWSISLVIRTLNDAAVDQFAPTKVPGSLRKSSWRCFSTRFNASPRLMVAFGKRAILAEIANAMPRDKVSPATARNVLINKWGKTALNSAPGDGSQRWSDRVGEGAILAMELSCHKECQLWLGSMAAVIETWPLQTGEVDKWTTLLTLSHYIPKSSSSPTKG